MTMYHLKNDAIIDNQQSLLNSDPDLSTVLIIGLMLDRLLRVHRPFNQINRETFKMDMRDKDQDLNRWSRRLGLGIR